MAHARRRVYLAPWSQMLAFFVNANFDPAKGDPARPHDFNPYLPAPKKPERLKINARELASLLMAARPNRGT